MLLLPLVALATRVRGMARVQRRLAASAERQLRARPADLPSPRPERIAFLVQLAAHRGPYRANCLQRSLVLWWALRARGIPGELRIGVRRPEQGAALDFHAWVELDDRVLNDAEDIRNRYVVFDRAIAPEGASFA